MAACLQTQDVESEYQHLINFSSLGIGSFLYTQLLLWFVAIFPMLIISVGLSKLLGKLSDKFFCVPLINPDNVKYDIINLEDAKGFAGFGSKIKALIKGITLAGIVVSMINTNLIMGSYEPCTSTASEYQDTQTTTILAWTASLCAYIMVWKIDFTIGVLELNVCKKMLWFITARLITLIIGGSFVRVIYLSKISDDEFCYCNSEDLLLANTFTIVYIGLWPILWILNKLNFLKFLVVIFGYILVKYIKCESENCCCKVRVKLKTPTGPVGKACNVCMKPCCTGCSKVCGLCAGHFASITAFLAFIITPIICIGIRLQVVGDKWQNHLVTIGNETQLDITDIVFIWILSVMMTFFMITGFLKLKRKICPPKIKDAENEDEKEDEESVSSQAEILRLRTLSKVKDDEQIIELAVAEKEITDIKKQLKTMKNQKKDIESKYRKLSVQNEKFESLQEENEALKKQLATLSEKESEPTKGTDAKGETKE